MWELVSRPSCNKDPLVTLIDGCPVCVFASPALRRAIDEAPSRGQPMDRRSHAVVAMVEEAEKAAARAKAEEERLAAEAAAAAAAEAGAEAEEKEVAAEREAHATPSPAQEAAAQESGTKERQTGSAA